MFSPCVGGENTRFFENALQLLKGHDAQPVELKALDVLRLLLERAPDAVDKSEIFSTVWKDVAVTDNALTHDCAAAQGDERDAKDPRYIATVSTRGYRMVATVQLATDSSIASDSPRTSGGRASMIRMGVAAVLAAVTGVAVWMVGRARSGVRDRGAVASTAGLDVATAASLRPVQMTAARAFDGFLAFSPDGGTIVYASDRARWRSTFKASRKARRRRR